MGLLNDARTLHRLNTTISSIEEPITSRVNDKLRSLVINNYFRQVSRDGSNESLFNELYFNTSEASIVLDESKSRAKGVLGKMYPQVYCETFIPLGITHNMEPCGVPISILDNGDIQRVDKNTQLLRKVIPDFTLNFLTNSEITLTLCHSDSRSTTLNLQQLVINSLYSMNKHSRQVSTWEEFQAIFEFQKRLIYYQEQLAGAAN
jgi:hypothetical protein